MSTSAWATHALQAFDNVVAAQAHLRPRAGQREMAAQVAHTFAHAHLGKPTEGEDSPQHCGGPLYRRHPGGHRRGQIPGLQRPGHCHGPAAGHAGGDLHRHRGAAESSW